MRLISASIAGSLLALAACSSSEGDGGIEKDPASGSSTTSTTGNTTTTAAGDSTGPGTGQTTSTDVGSGAGGDTSTSTGSGAGGATPSNQNAASLHGWARFQGEFDSEEQQPKWDDEPVPSSPRRLVGCALDAPELGDRVVYVERTEPGSESPPDRQFVLSFGPSTAEGADPVTQATATIHRVIDPSEWEGRCQVGETLPLVGSVTAEDGCALAVELVPPANELFISGTSLAAQCVAPLSEATTMNTSLYEIFHRMEWYDVLTDAEGTEVRDPQSTSEPPAIYRLQRRSESPEIPQP